MKPYTVEAFKGKRRMICRKFTTPDAAESYAKNLSAEYSYVHVTKNTEGAE